MKLFKIPAGTQGYKIKWPHVVQTTTTAEIVAEQGFSREPGEFWYTNDPIMARNRKETVGVTIGHEMTRKGYSTIVTHDKSGKEHTLFVPFSKVECLC